MSRDRDALQYQQMLLRKISRTVHDNELDDTVKVEMIKQHWEDVGNEWKSYLHTQSK